MILIQFIFVIDYLVEILFLVWFYCSKFGLVEWFELFIVGCEYVNVFSEFIDFVD